MYCTVHPLSQVSLICVAPHKCQFQRKMCVECQYEHGVEVKQAIPMTKFRELAIQKLKGYKLDDISELNKQRLGFKQLLSKTETMLKKLWDDLSHSIGQIYEMIENENKTYFNLLIQNENLAESSYSDLEKLVQLQEGTILDDWNNKKNLYIAELEKAKEWLENEAVTFRDKFKKEMKEISFLFQEQKEEKVQCQYSSQEINSGIWVNESLIYSKLKIINSQNQKIQYIQDGSIIRIDQIIDTTTKPEILINLEQIQYLQWFGQYGQNKQKVGQWIAKWKGKQIKDAGGQYSNNGKKQGQWKELISNYQTQAKAYEIGEYDDGLRKGKWKYLYNNKYRHGGEYNEKGERHGKWFELFEGICDYFNITLDGRYQNGKKVGKWDIWFKKDEKIAGGWYDEEGEGLKQGNWIEISDNFYNESQVTFNGEYKNGKKVGKWDIWFKKDEKDEKIAGGQYDEEGEGFKQGNWIEISDNFHNNSQVTYNGEYKNGKKVGKWDIWFKKDEKNEKIAGGFYNEDGLKMGYWIQISDHFCNESQVKYNGEYKNGIKVGKWDILYKGIFLNKNYEKMQNYHIQFNSPHDYVSSGDGSYDVAGLKQGIWTVLKDQFKDTSYIKYVGQYNNGKKVGRWDILFQNMKIGGGAYDNGVKSGIWVVESNNFSIDSGVTYQGSYNNGKKISRWEIWYEGYFKNETTEMIGGGSYDEAGYGLKMGNWTEISDQFERDTQITLNGEYENGKKVGVWETIDRNLEQFKKNKKKIFNWGN